MEGEKNLKPILLHYYITNRCNARCGFCEIWKETPKIDAAADDVVRNLADARTAGCRFVDFTGGEPLLHPDLPRFCTEAKRLGFITSVTTNCIVFPDRAASLAGLIDLLHFSLDADSQALHDRLRGAESYDSVIESIPIALSNGLVPDLLFTYTDDNINSFEGVYGLARKNRLMVILDPMFSLDGKDHVGRATHDRAAAYARRPGVYLNRALLDLRFLGGNSARSAHRNFCRAVSSTIVVLPDNSLALPCFHHAVETVPIAGSLSRALADRRRLDAGREQGLFMFCRGCHINCYFDPSFTSHINTLLLKSLKAKLFYGFTKYFIYKRKLPFRRFL
jgi:MoaA/NifB/PqqE/SkfB family radical SAM enzyme